MGWGTSALGKEGHDLVVRVGAKACTLVGVNSVESEGFMIESVIEKFGL